MISENIYRSFGICDELAELVRASEAKVRHRFEAIDEIAEYNTLKVVRAMQECGVS